MIGIILIVIALFGIAFAGFFMYAVLETVAERFDTSFRNVVLCISSVVALVVALVVAIPFLSDRLYRLFFPPEKSHSGIEERYQEALKAEN